MHRFVLLASLVLVGILFLLSWAVSEGPQSECFIVSESGSYSLANDIVGAPFDAPELPFGGKACIKINSSNVDLDCKGHRITNEGFFDTAGILISGPVSNVKVSNCVVDKYEYDFYIKSSSNGFFVNNTAITRLFHGHDSHFAIVLSDSNEFHNNSVSSETMSFAKAFGLESSSNNIFSGNDISHSGTAFYLDYSQGNVFNRNYAHDNEYNGFTLGSSDSNNISHNSVENSVYGIYLIDSNSNNIEGNAISNSNFSNIMVDQSNSNSIIGNNFSNSEVSVSVENSNGNNFDNNRIFQNNESAFKVGSAVSNSFARNTIYENSLGFGLYSGAEGNSFISNVLYNNSRGFEVMSCSNNEYTGNIVHDAEFEGFYFKNSSDNKITDNTVYGVINATGILLESSTDNNISQNTVHSSDAGIGFMQGSGSNFIFGNTVFNNSRSGIQLESSSSKNQLKENVVYTNQYNGISVDESPNNNIENNVAFQNGQSGIFVLSSPDSRITSSKAYNNFFAGIVVIGSQRVNISDNIAYNNNPASVTFFGEITGGIAIFDSSNIAVQRNFVSNNSQYGIGLLSSTGNFVKSNSIINNSMYGIYVDRGVTNQSSGIPSDNNRFSNNEINNQRTGYGFYIKNSTDNALENDHFFRNNFDFFINATKPINIKLIKENFDAPEGKYENNTMLSINDTLKAVDSYSIRWAQNSTTTKIPAGTFTLKKFVNMTTSYPYLEIDSITWHWTDKDVQDADEKSIQLWSYNNTWNLENFTLNTTTNSLNISNVNASFYGLVYATPRPSDCRYVSISINFTPACDGNNVVVSAGGSLLSLANVTVIREGGIIASGLTDSVGKFTFNGTGQSADMYVEKNRTPDTCYSVPGAGKFTVNLKNPADCGRPECTVNSDCPSGQVCTSNKCTPSTTLECTNDTDCQNGRVCQNGKCVEQLPPTGEGCTSDDNCTAEQFCSAESCIPVATEACGHIVNHAWVPYECCSNADCASSGQGCEDNKCVARGGNYSIVGANIGYIGQTATFTAYLDSEPLANADIKVTMPDGSFEVLTADSDGNVSFLVAETGAYTIDLMVNDNAEYTLILTSLSSSSIAPGGIPLSLGFLAQAGVLLVFVVFVIAVLAFLVYYFFIGGKGGEKGTLKKQKKKRKKEVEEAQMTVEPEQ